MAFQSKSANLEFYVNGNRRVPPKEWQDLEVTATFDEGEVQANIVFDKFTFGAESYEDIKKHIEDGFIFEGLDFQIRTVSTLGSLVTFEGFIDTEDDLVENREFSQFEANIKQIDDISTFNDKLNSLSLELLYEKGIITDQDFQIVDYVVQPVDTSRDAFLVALSLFTTAKAGADAAKEVFSDTANSAALTANPVTVANGASLAIALTALNVVYLGIILVQIVNLQSRLINLFVPPIRTHKAINVKTVFEKVCQFFGYGFNTTYTIFDNLYYLPSNINVDEYNDIGFLKKAKGIEKGIPNATDFGYSASEFFQIGTFLNGRFGVIDNTVQLHSELSPYWERQSTWVLRNKRQDTVRRNTEDLQSNVFVKLITDTQDDYTIENFKGTNYQVITDAKIIQDEKKKTIVGLREFALPLALGNRKDKLNGFESFLRSLASLIDFTTNAISKLPVPGLNKLKTDFTSKLDNKIGVLKVSQNNHSIPKLLYLENGRLPQDHREKWSAEVAYSLGPNEISFLFNNFQRQREIYDNVNDMPFGFEDFVTLVRNSFFVTSDSRRGKVTRINWKIFRDKATLDYYIQQIYTRNLEEQIINPE